jgi:hypothetical protein
MRTQLGEVRLLKVKVEPLFKAGLGREKIPKYLLTKGTEGIIS